MALQGKRIANWIPNEELTDDLYFGVDRLDLAESQRVPISKFRIYSSDVVKVGTGGDFATIEEAIAGGYKNIKIISDVDENGSTWQLTDRVTINIFSDNSYNINISGDKKVTLDVSFNPKIFFTGVKLNFSSAENLGDAYFGYADIENKDVEINSNTEDVKFGYNVTYSKGLTLNLTNNNFDITFVGRVENSLFTGAFDYVSSQSHGIKFLNAIIDNLTISGSWKQLMFPYSIGTFNNLVMTDVTGGYLSVYEGCTFNLCTGMRIINIEGAEFNKSSFRMILNAKNSKFDNCQISSFSYAEVGEGNKFIDCQMPDLELYAQKNDVKFIRCLFVNNLLTTKNSIYSEKLVIDDCKWTAGSVTLSGNNGQFRNSYVLNDTITIESTADNNNVQGNYTLTEISDSGTNTHNLIDNYLI